MKAVALAVVLLLALSCTRGVTALLLREHPLPISLLSENLRGDAAEGTTVVDLGGDTWRVASSNGSITAPATVPGVVHLDLLKAKVIEDPYIRYHDVDYRWIALTDWTYARRFTVSADLLAHIEVVLVCEGLDTVASVTINNKVIGHADNMFRRYIFTVPRGLLRSGSDNTITISFTSAETYAKARDTLRRAPGLGRGLRIITDIPLSRARAAQTPYELPSADNLTQQSGEPFRNYIRKEQCSFSWDWGPAFLPQGVYKPISLVGYSSPIITALVPQTLPVGSAGSRHFRVEVETVLLMPAEAKSLAGTLKVSVAGATQNVPCQLRAGENRVRATLLVPDVELWWPVGYGSQPLYSLSATFTPLAVSAEHVSSPLYSVSEERKIGFRTVELITDKFSNQNGSSMYFRVNGVPIFAKGANFVPMDSFENRVHEEDLALLVQDALDANMNILRVWGGGVYQQDSFYQLCDEKGIMVWQEFMFACAMYPRDEQYLANTAAEVTHQVERLTHHPSIILWSGSNENEAALDWFDVTRNNPRLYAVDYAKLYFDTIRETLLTVDTSRPFWPSSPSNGVIEENPYVGVWGNPYDQTMGDVHYYNYAADCTNVATFPNTRFASEYGYQSFPSFETWQPVTQQGDWHPFSDLMKHRQHHPDGNDQVLAQIQHYFRYNVTDTVQSFKDFLYLSQATQALCIKAQSEHYRRNKGMAANTMGAIYWQLNDIWQAPTWSSIEYGGRWKLLHHYAKHFFAPVLVSAYEQPNDRLQVHVTSDVNKPLSGTLYTRLWTWSGTGELAEWKTPFSLASLASQSVLSASISSLISGKCKQRADCFLTFSVVDASFNELAFNVFYLANIVQSALPKAQISVQVSPGNSSREVVVQLISDSSVPFVYLDSSYPVKGRFDDNGFLLLPMSYKKVVFRARGDEAIDYNLFQRGLVVRSPRDVY